MGAYLHEDIAIPPIGTLLKVGLITVGMASAGASVWRTELLSVGTALVGPSVLARVYLLRPVIPKKRQAPAGQEQTQWSCPCAQPHAFYSVTKRDDPKKGDFQVFLIRAVFVSAPINGV